MILRSLRLRNFRSHRDSRIAFPEGVVGILGPNGAGKSAIFEGIAWALFGDGMSRTGGYALGSSGLSEAHLTFEHGARSFAIFRKSYGHPGWGSVTASRDGEVAATGTAECEKVISAALPMDGPAFLRTHCCRQGELHGLAREGAERRSALLVRLLGLERLDTALEHVRRDLAACPTSRDPPGDVHVLKRRLRELETLETEAVRQEVIRGDVARLERELARFGSETPPSQGRGPAESRARVLWLEAEEQRLSRRLAALADASGDTCPLCGGPLSRSQARARLQGERVTIGGELRAARLETVRASAIERRERVRQELERKRATMRPAKALAETRTERLETLKAIETSSARRARALLARVEELLGDFRSLILKDCLSRVAEEASRVLTEASGGAFSRVEIGRDLKIRMDGLILQRYSGGEQAMAALALRAGLSLLVSENAAEFLALDEPFDSLDAAHRKLLLAAISRLPFRQVFVVSHHEDIQDLLPAAILVRKSAGTSQVTNRNASGYDS